VVNEFLVNGHEPDNNTTEIGVRFGVQF